MTAILFRPLYVHVTYIVVVDVEVALRSHDSLKNDNMDRRVTLEFVVTYDINPKCFKQIMSVV